MDRATTCCFTGHRPNKLPWGEDERAPRCLALKARLAELLEMARRFGLEPKRLRMVQHDAAGIPGLVLLECRRGGKPGLRAEPALLLYGPDGRETAEHRRAYFREEEQAL